MLVLTPVRLTELLGPGDVSHVGTIAADGATEKLWVLSHHVNDGDWLNVATNYPHLETFAAGIDPDGTRILIDIAPLMSPTT